MFAYPKLKYQPKMRPDGHFHHVRVNDPNEEEALVGDWYDTPGEMPPAAPLPPEPEAEPEPVPVGQAEQELKDLTAAAAMTKKLQALKRK